MRHVEAESSEPGQTNEAIRPVMARRVSSGVNVAHTLGRWLRNLRKGESRTTTPLEVPTSLNLWLKKKLNGANRHRDRSPFCRSGT